MPFRIIHALLLIIICVTNAGASEPQQSDRARPDSPTPYTASYSANYNGLAIETIRTLSFDGTYWHLELNAHNFLGSINESEVFEDTSVGQFNPIRYSYNRKILGKSRKESMKIDPETGEAISDRKDKTKRLAPIANWLGPLSYQQQMQRDVAAGKPVNYSIILRGKVKNHIYNIVGEEKLETPVGSLNTLVLERQREDSDRHTLLWLAPDLDYLPVKLFQRETDGENYEMLIKDYTQTTTKGE